MKKIFSILFNVIFILACVFFVYICYRNPKVPNEIAIRVTDVYDSIQGNNVVKVYDKSDKINSLQIKSSDYYYNKLSDNQKKVYDSIATAVRYLNKEAVVKQYVYTDNKTLTNDMAVVIDAFFADHPEVFYLDSKYQINTSHMVTGTRVGLTLNYSVKDKTELDSQIAMIESKISEYISKVTAEAEFNKELQLHDLLGNNVTYREYTTIEEIPEECHTIYGAFVDNSAVCDGFTKAMQILLDKQDIESILVTGKLENEAHAWNMVKINESWYHLDLTSDKSLNKDFGNNENIIHSYFNVTTEKIKATHSIENESNIPEAINTEENYYIKTNRFIYKRDNFNVELKRILDNDINNTCVEFETENISDVPDKISNIFTDNKYKSFLTTKSTFKYYKVLDSYILIKGK